MQGNVVKSLGEIFNRDKGKIKECSTINYEFLRMCDINRQP